jgi:hypothetical protein
VKVQCAQMGPSCVIGAKKNLGPFLLLRPKVLVPNSRHVDYHVGCEDIWDRPQCKALGLILTIPSNPIGRILDDLGRHPFGLSKYITSLGSELNSVSGLSKGNGTR